MLTYKTRSIKQVITKEWGLVLFISMVSLIIPLLVFAGDYITITNFISLPPIQKLLVLLKRQEMKIIDLNFLMYFQILAAGIMLPIFASLIAYRLRGNSFINSFKQTFESFKTMRFWKYVLKIYLPLEVLALVIYYLSKQITTYEYALKVIAKLIDSHLLLVSVYAGVFIGVSICVLFLMMIVSANIYYVNGADRIINSFKMLTFREILKLSIPAILRACTYVGIIAVVVNSFRTDDIFAFLDGSLLMIVDILVILISVEIILAFIQTILIINVGSKGKLKSKEEEQLKLNHSSVELLTTFED